MNPWRHINTIINNTLYRVVVLTAGPGTGTAAAFTTDTNGAPHIPVATWDNVPNIEAAVELAEKTLT